MRIGLEPVKDDLYDVHNGQLFSAKVNLNLNIHIQSLG